MARGGHRQGAGRPKGATKSEGMPSKVIRVSAEISKEQCEAIPELIAILNHWEDDCLANPDSARHYYLRKALDEIRALGF
jgi:hypothetical protein